MNILFTIKRRCLLSSTNRYTVYSFQNVVLKSPHLSTYKLFKHIKKETLQIFERLNPFFSIFFSFSKLENIKYRKDNIVKFQLNNKKQKKKEKDFS